MDKRCCFAVLKKEGCSAVSEIVAAAIRRRIFDEGLYKKYQILTSEGIQKRYFEIVSRRKEVKVKKEYLLINTALKYKNVNILEGTENILLKNVDNSEQSKVKKSKENKSKVKHIICAAVEHLNSALGTNYKSDNEGTVRLITARVNEGYTEDDIKAVIDKKVKEWKGTDMEKYLRPETLFGNKFEGYLNSKSITTSKFSNYSCTSDYDFGDIENKAILRRDNK